MLIGLYDDDLYYNEIPKHLKLSLMKVASYFKRRGDIVKLSPQFEPQKYSKVFYFKDGNDPIKENLSKWSNVEIYGKYFSGGQYRPMSEEIEQSIPDTSIYFQHFYRIEKDYTEKKIILPPKLTSIRSELRSDCHVRLSLDEKNIWGKYRKSLPRSRSNIIVLYDRKLPKIAGALTEVQWLVRNKGIKHCYIHSCYPLFFNKFEDLFKWVQLPIIQSVGLFYSKPFKDNEISELVECGCDLKRIRYQPQNNFINNEEKFLKEELQKIFRQAIFCRANNKYFPLMFRSDFLSDDVYDILELIHTLANDYYSRKFNSLAIEYARSRLTEDPVVIGKKLVFSKNRLRELFQMVKLCNPELYNLFHTCRNVKFEGGKLIEA